MTILSGDIKLVASQVMDDVPEGGGAPTATAIVDGASNAIFPDISELDRAGGRINLRKLHVHVQTADRDTYLGGNVKGSRLPFNRFYQAMSIGIQPAIYAWTIPSLYCNVITVSLHLLFRVITQP